MPGMDGQAGASTPNFGRAWLVLSLALCAHVTDEALTGFLPMYNATVLAMRARYAWFPMPTYVYREWLSGLIVACAVLLPLTPLAYRNARYLRPFAYFFAVIMFLNGTGHTLATIFGRTVATVHVARPAPGFYSSPLLFAGSVYLFLRLRASAASRSPSRTSDAN
jgi:hypothetical protein